MTTNTHEIDTILASPQFDAEKFLYYTDLSESYPALMMRIVNDPNMFLYLISSEHESLLNRYINKGGFNHDIFVKIHEEYGFELWSKKTAAGNIWYGLIVDDKAVYFDKVGRTRYIRVSDVSDEEQLEEVKKSWKKLKLKPGIDNKLENNMPFISKVRKRLLEELKSKGWQPRSYWYTRNYKAPSMMFYRYPKLHNNWRRVYAKIDISRSGSKIRAKIMKLAANATYRDNWEIDKEQSFVIKDSNKQTKDPGVLSKEIMKWIGDLTNYEYAG